MLAINEVLVLRIKHGKCILSKNRNKPYTSEEVAEAIRGFNTKKMKDGSKACKISRVEREEDE